MTEVIHLVPSQAEQPLDALSAWSSRKYSHYCLLLSKSQDQITHLGRPSQSILSKFYFTLAAAVGEGDIHILLVKKGISEIK